MDAHIAHIHIHIYEDEYIHLESLNATEKKKRFYLLYSNSSTHFVYFFFRFAFSRIYICFRLLSATIRYIAKHTWNLLPLFPFSVFSITAFRFIYPLIRCFLKVFFILLPSAISFDIRMVSSCAYCAFRVSLHKGNFFKWFFFHRFPLDFCDNKF